MKIQRIDHVGINVNDLAEAKAFFLDFGFEVQWEGEMGGELLETVVGLRGAKTSVVMIGLPDGQMNLELIKYHTPTDKRDIQQPFANTLGIRHIAFVVDDIEATVAKLKKKGVEIFSEIQNYEDTYKLCYIRGPEGIILELAEQIK
jgi:catechol 2,3-dioxygenase-like lactoylglutathione lyase family enzyme